MIKPLTLQIVKMLGFFIALECLYRTDSFFHGIAIKGIDRGLPGYGSLEKTDKLLKLIGTEKLVVVFPVVMVFEVLPDAIARSYF